MSSSSLLLLALSLLGGWCCRLSFGFLLAPLPPRCVPRMNRKHNDMVTILYYDANNNNSNDTSDSKKGNTNKKNQPKKKKRRFAQDIHQSKSSLQDFGTRNIASLSTTTTTTTSRKNNPKKDNMSDNNNIFLQRSKSIEELERTMTQRYGTKMEQWTFDVNGNDSEYELVFDDTNDKKGRSNLGEDNNNRPKRKSGKFKGRPVMDPWAKMGKRSNNEDDEDGVPPKKKKEKHAKRKMTAATSAATSAATGMNPNNNKRDSNNSNNNIQNKKKTFFQKTEFYDEDDVGYEGQDHGYDIDFYDNNYDNDDDVNFYNHIISPQPVGGRGRKKNNNNNREPPRPLSKKPKEDDNENAGGFFSRSTQMASSSSSTVTTQQKATPKKNKKNNDDASISMESSFSSSTTSLEENNTNDHDKTEKSKTKKEKLSPMLDDNGKEMYLTLDQVPSICSTAATIMTNKVDKNDKQTSAFTATPSKEEEALISWEDIGITHPVLLENLRKHMSCPTPLPVQIQSSTAILQNKKSGTDTDNSNNNDIIISTPTGSGKTLAFLVPLVQQLLDEHEQNQKGTSSNKNKNKKTEAKQLRAIVVAPGRELASQIIQVSRDLLRNTGMSSQLAIGGTPFTRTMEQIRKKKPTIIVGTPGRLAELIVGSSSNDNGRNNKRIKIPATNYIVLDECDALLGTSTTDNESSNYGYNNPHAEPTNAILSALKRQHSSNLKSVLCSATATDLILSPTEEDDVNITGMRNKKYKDYEMIQLPHQEGMTTTTSPTALHGIIHVPHKRFALDTLKRILHTHPMPAQVLIFVNTPHRVKITVEKLAEMGIIAAPFTGAEQKQDRTDVNKALREGYVGIVVATEMAARGIDAPYLTHVINYDLPTDASHYAHRAGRVARGGRPGIVINMTTSPRERHVPFSKFAKPLKLENQMFIVEARDGKLPIMAVSNRPEDSDSSE